MDAESDKVAHFYMMKDIKKHYQIPSTAEELVDLYHAHLFNHDMTLKNHSQHDIKFKKIHFFSENAFRRMLQEYHIKPTVSDIHFFNATYLGNHLKYVRLAEGCWEAIDLVKAKGCHCGIISDIDQDYQYRQFQALNLTNAFHSITTSEEVQNYKPEPAIFKTALKKASCSGDEALMVGDSHGKDIVGGKNINMTTIWINRYQNHIEEAKAKQADYTVGHFKEIVPIFEQLL